MPRITIEQLGDDGSTNRTFEMHPASDAVEQTLHRITFAYHLPSTRVSVDGKPIQLERPNGDRSVTDPTWYQAAAAQYARIEGPHGIGLVMEPDDLEQIRQIADDCMDGYEPSDFDGRTYDEELGRRVAAALATLVFGPEILR